VGGIIYFPLLRISSGKMRDLEVLTGLGDIEEEAQGSDNSDEED